MNRYQIANARERIFGYYLPAPHETDLRGRIAAFKRAQAEAVDNLRRAARETAALSPEQFFGVRKFPDLDDKA